MVNLAASFDEPILVFPAVDRYGETPAFHTERVLCPKEHLVSYVKAAYGKLADHRPDVVYFLKPNPFSFLPALAAQLGWGARLVLDCDEWEPATMADNGVAPWKVWLSRLLTSWAARVADAVIVSNRNIIARLPSGARARSTYVPNGVDSGSFRANTETKTGEADAFTLTYVGSMYKERQIEPILKALPQLEERLDDFRLMMVGPGNLEVLRGSVTSERVVFTGSVPHERVPHILSNSDVLLAVFAPLTSLEYASNMKVFEYMASGKPIVASAVGEIPDILLNGRAGYLVNGQNPDELADAVVEIARSPGRAAEKARTARALARDKYDWQVLSNRLKKVIDAHCTVLP